jgi:hypothetical protein
MVRFRLVEQLTLPSSIEILKNGTKLNVAREAASQSTIHLVESGGDN